MKLAVIGYGVEGVALAEYFSQKGDSVTICDAKKKDIKLKNAHKRFGQHYLQGLTEFDFVFRSPGIPYLTKKLLPVREKLTSLTKYFFQNCPCVVIGVTGTKGKGTVASLIYEMAKEGYKGGEVFLGGNIGNPPIKFLDQLTPRDLVILELSSFQLQDLNKSPHIAIVLNISPDHLDHHKTFDEYANAKKNIVKFQTSQDFAILDADNETALSFERATKAIIVHASIKKPVEEGAFLKVDSFVLKSGKTGTIFGKKGYVKLPGDHNIKNIFMAAAAANILKIPVNVITKVAREFPELPHRLEFVKEVNGTRFYDDSASTNPATAIAALRTFSEPTILIAGGSDKNADFTPLGDEIAKRLNVKTVIVMGETKKKLENAIETAYLKEEKRMLEEQAKTGRPIRKREMPLEIISAESYQEAFMVAKLLSEPGDTVLLSPACASFGMFTNYKERGEIFKDFVLSLV